MSFKKVDPKLDLPEEEEKILKFWRENKIFEKSLKKNEGKKKFVFYEGPPTANGKPGIHHVLARAFKDVIPRYRTMMGDYVPRKAGWDTHGLPVELEVEKALGISGKDKIENIISGDKIASIEKFNKTCKESVWKYKKDWEELTRRIFFWLDMEHPYITYDKNYIETLWWIVSEVEKKGLLYRGHKVVPFCPRCGTALSSHEVAQGYEDVTETSVYIKFKIKPGQKFGDNYETKDSAYVIAWTTTPWTLPGNAALAVGKDIKYTALRVEGAAELYVVANDRVKDVFKNEKLEIVHDNIPGRDLAGLKYDPLFEIKSGNNENSHKILLADFVTTEDGTGIVHTAVMYGEDDYLLGEKAGLPKNHTVSEEGKFLPNVPKWEGRFVKEVESEIIEDIKSRGLLYKTELTTHSYPHCWRCHSVLIYYARDSWYIKMSQLRDQLAANNNKINWVPKHIKDGRFGNWLENLNDWAISRSRYWGTPLPVWQCQGKNQKSKIKNQNYCNFYKVIGSYEELKKSSIGGLDLGALDPHRPYVDEVKIKCEKCGSEMERVPDVMDCWFDSGSMPYAQHHYPFENEELFKTEFPAEYIAEAVDQTRGWFYTLLAVSTLVSEQESYKNVICLGHILDERGRKMSKSLGNIINPWDVINKFGADPLRYFMYTVNQPGEPKIFSEKAMLTVTRNVFLTLWNVHSFFMTYASIDNFKPEKNRDYRNILDLWVVTSKNELISEVKRNLEKYNIYEAALLINNFINQLSTWYIRRSRKRFWKSENDSDKNEAFNAVHEVLTDLVKVMAPFSPAFAEILFQGLRDDKDPESVHLCDFPEVGSINKGLNNHMNRVMSMVTSAHSLRSASGIKLRQPLATFKYRGEKLPKEFEEILLEELNVKNVENSASIEATKINETEFDDIWFDKEITPQLRSEGLAREIVRSIQSLRKTIGLEVEDRIEVAFYSESEEISKVILDNNKYISKETLALKLNDSKSIPDNSHQIKVEGREVDVSITKAA
jgi:isoleucyl-tRNA synthetase